MMTEQERAGERLAAERADALVRLNGLERDLAAIIESSGAAGIDDEHDPEGATIAFERQHAAALLSQARQQLAEIDAALRRVAAGSYGRCDKCGRPIGTERLAARPAATTCIRCASAR
jgi:DnaK suppressor protein